MADRAELVEAALEVYREGLALLDKGDRVIFWNRAAEAITGYSGAHVLGRELPASLEALARGPVCEPDDTNRPRTRGAMVHAQHQRGHDLPVTAYRILLRDGLGERIGCAAVFRGAEQAAALAHLDSGRAEELTDGQADLAERLAMEFEACRESGAQPGILWITVDQGEGLRKTHGARACEAMLEAVERALANALLAGEELGRWSDNEFLLTTRDGAVETLAKRAQALAGIARTTDFRWWGDRISVTVSIGLAAAGGDESLAELVERSRRAMEASIHADGNHVTVASGRKG